LVTKLILTPCGRGKRRVAGVKEKDTEECNVEFAVNKL
jgi:hypothetical protein